MDFSDRLIELIQSRGITRRELAQSVNVSERLLYYYVAGQKTPNMETLIALADFFNVSLDYLVGRTDDPTPPKRSSSSNEPGS